MLLQDVFAYSEKEKVLGTVVEYSRLNATATIQSDKDLYTVDANDIYVMRKIGKMNKTMIYEGDVFKVVGSDVHYVIELDEAGNLAMLTVLDKKMKRLENADVFPIEDLRKFSHALELKGNYYLLKNQLPSADFNIQVVREHTLKETNYYYIGHNEDEETLDVIKVIFIGSAVLPEEKYERTTISYEDYHANLKDSKWKVARPQEIANYIYGMGQETEIQPKNESRKQEEELMEIVDKPVKQTKLTKCHSCNRIKRKCTCDLFE